MSWLDMFREILVDTEPIIESHLSNEGDQQKAQAAAGIALLILGAVSAFKAKQVPIPATPPATTTTTTTITPTPAPTA